MRIWWQSFVDPATSPAYVERLSAHLDELAHEGTNVEVFGLAPPDRAFGRLTELRCAVLAVDNALEAAEQGYDAFAFGHFQDPGLYEARSAVDIPVTGLGEATLHWAAQLGRRLGLVSIDPVFESWHLEQADLYGLGGRVSHVVGLGSLVEDFEQACGGDEAARARLLARFRELAEPLVADGADVIVPAGALPAMLLAGEQGAAIGDAPIVNSVAVLLKCTEAAVELRRLTGLGPSRGPSFAAAPPQAVADFRALLRHGRAR
jgi:Asp/Glu/hydantoin racemase